MIWNSKSNWDQKSHFEIIVLELVHLFRYEKFKKREAEAKAAFGGRNFGGGGGGGRGCFNCGEEGHMSRLVKIFLRRAYVQYLPKNFLPFICFGIRDI